MSKRKKRHAETRKEDIPAASVPEEGGGISATGWKTVAAGAVLVALGFFVLTKSDPMGRNWAASLCPFLILGGYAVMGWGIFRDDPPSSPSPGPEKTT